MRSRFGFCLASFAVIAGTTCNVHAESFTSSASSAGSASSGSVSDSFHGSSNSSNDDKKTADGDYRIVEVAEVAGRTDYVRVTMLSDQTQQRIALDLPGKVFAKQGLIQGDLVHTQRRPYGYEFAHADTRLAFYLVLADDWHDELAPRVVRSL